MVDRRAFLKRAVAAASGVVAVGGIFSFRRAYAIGRVRDDLLNRASDAITEKERQELERLPSLASASIRDYVHGLCLDSYKFAEEVCSESFQDRLASCTSAAERQKQVYSVFHAHIFNEREFQNRIGKVAERIGAELDRNWVICCDAVAEAWGVAVRPYETGFGPSDLSQRTEPLIRRHMQAAARDAVKKTCQPAILNLASSLGTSALLLLPVMSQVPYVGVPVFAWQAFQPIFDFLIGLFRSPTANVQLAVTQRLSQLSSDLCRQFEREIRERIVDLHSWQYRSVRDVASEQAARTVGWL
jgi:hypothetical protein